MDEADVILSLMLLQNSRVSYRTLAEKLNMSVNAVHKRIQSLIEAGVIKGFTTKPSLKVTGALFVYIYGLAQEHLRDVSLKLSKNDSVFWVAQASGGYIYVGLYARSLSELSSLSEFVRETAKMPDPKVGIIQSGSDYPATDKTLDTFDWQIIHQLENDSRKPLAEIAVELNASAKTVRRRLNWMIKNYLIELSIKWFPDASEDIISVFHAKTVSGKGINRIDFKELSPNLLFTVVFLNIPDEILLFTWARTMRELREVRDKIEANSLFSRVSMNILYVGEIFPTWVDDLPLKMSQRDQT